VSVAPAEIYGITANQAQVPDLNLIGYALGLQNSFTRPFIYTLSARASASKLGSLVLTFLIIGPDNLDGEVIGLSNLAGLNRRTTRF
jgi:hypothetical protein